MSSDSDPLLSSDSILVKWRCSTLSGTESWNNSTIIITGGSLFEYWLVDVLSEQIMGFIVHGMYSPSMFSLSHYLSLYVFFESSSLPSASSDFISSIYLIYFIQYPSLHSSRKLFDTKDPTDAALGSLSRDLSISNPGISVSISPNKTISWRTIRQYISGVSDQHLYLLNSGLRV